MTFTYLSSGALSFQGVFSWARKLIDDLNKQQSGGVSDGDKGEVIVDNYGALWTLTDTVKNFLLARANHTGTQPSDTISDLDAAVNAILKPGANVTLVYDSALKTITISAAGGGGAGVTDGDKGDVVVSGGGTTWLLDAATVAALVNRANHTGVQLAATISDFAEATDDRVAALLVQGAGITLTYNDGANTLTISAAVPPKEIRFGNGYPNMLNGETLLRFITPRALTFAANFADWPVAVGGSNPSATYVITINVNGVSIGTISISAAGAVTKATTGGLAQAAAANDVITWVAPANAETIGVGLIVTATGVGVFP